MDKNNDIFDLLENIMNAYADMDEDQQNEVQQLMTGELTIEELLNKRFYFYQHPDYKPFITEGIADWIRPIWEMKDDGQSESAVNKRVVKAAKNVDREEMKKDIRSLIFRLLDCYDGNGKSIYNIWQLFGPLWLVEHYDIDDFLYPVLEILRQDAYFYKDFLYYTEEAMAAAVYRQGKDNLEQLEAFLYERDILPNAKPIAMGALIWTALRQPQKRLKVVSIITAYLKYCLEICRQGASAANIEGYAVALASAHIQETMPMLRKLYEELDFMPMQAMGGIEEIEALMNDREEPFVCSFDNIDDYLKINWDELMEKKYKLVAHEVDMGMDPLLPFYEDDDEDYDEDSDDCFYYEDAHCKRFVVRAELMDGPELVQRTLQVPSNMYLPHFSQLLMMAFGRDMAPDEYLFKDMDDNFYTSYGCKRSDLRGDGFIDDDDYNLIEDILPKKGSIASFDIRKGTKTVWHHALVLEKSGRYPKKTQNFIDLIDGCGAYPNKSVKDMKAFAKLHQEGKIKQPNLKEIRVGLVMLNKIAGRPDNE